MTRKQENIMLKITYAEDEYEDENLISGNRMKTEYVAQEILEYLSKEFKDLKDWDQYHENIAYKIIEERGKSVVHEIVLLIKEHDSFKPILKYDLLERNNDKVVTQIFL